VVFSDLTILGSGTIVPLPNHGCSGYLLRGDARPILLDCGPGTLCRLAEIGVSAAEIRTLLVTHFHLDHVSDLAALLNSRWLQSPAGRREMQIIGPRGMEAHLSWLAARMDSWFADYAFTVHECSADTCLSAGTRTRCGKTGHTAESLCYRLEDERGKVFFYSGDTDYNEALVPLAEGADIAVIECSMPDDAKSSGHLTPLLAARLGRLAGVRKLVLTHFYREVTAVDILSQAREVFSGSIILAEDRMRIGFGEK
jgi:ribonuclease BN (tRNA processing enzyme)